MRIEHVTHYIAEDRTRFLTEDACRSYEDLCGQVDAIMATLPPKPDLEDESHTTPRDAAVVREARLAILRLALPHIGKVSWVQDTIDSLEGRRDDVRSGPIHWSWAGRVINQYCPSPIDRAWYRLSCIDRQGREWEQIYLANKANGLLDPPSETSKDTD